MGSGLEAKCRDHRSKTSSRARVPRRRAAINSRATGLNMIPQHVESKSNLH